MKGRRRRRRQGWHRDIYYAWFQWKSVALRVKQTVSFRNRLELNQREIRGVGARFLPLFSQQYFFIHEKCSYYFSLPLGLCLLAGRSMFLSLFLGEMKENRPHMYEWVDVCMYTWGRGGRRVCVPACLRARNIYARSNWGYDLPCIKAYRVTFVRTCHYVVLQTAI